MIKKIFITFIIGFLAGMIFTFRVEKYFAEREKKQVAATGRRNKIGRQKKSSSEESKSLEEKALEIGIVPEKEYIEKLKALQGGGGK